MSHYMTALAMRQKGLKPSTKIVLYWLADHHNETTGECFPSYSTLEAECEMHRATVMRHIDELVKLGLIERIKRTRANGSQTSNGYRLSLKNNLSQNATPPVANCDPHNLGNITYKKDNNKLLSTKDENDLALFEYEFWNDYPRKVGKKAAFKAWKRHIKNNKQEAPKIMLAYIDFTDQLEGKDEQFIPHLSTWINGERWKDGE